MSKASGVLSILAGAGAIYGTPNSVEPSVKMGLKVLGGIAIGYGIYELTFGDGGFIATAKAKITQETEEGGNAILGVLGRVTDTEPKPGVILKEYTGGSTGTPKNVIGIVGKIYTPVPGGSATVPAFADTIKATGAIENNGDVPRSGKLQARIIVEGEPPLLVGDKEITLNPGERYDVSLYVPYRHVGFTAFKTHAIAMIFSNYKLDETSFSIDRSFY